ncbi:NAD(P)H-dependent oxidoreductase subunit E [Treponema zuelzerae]|uniref:NAD(P)H-dependent oxidoreductase subunit E n=1 Tax=Teretinema zuelzerae TaxID=156 RepID=A0AAE3JIN2_9SPIR|nr:NAD(P)H-dependent oxidoreductase subunit E [Teretinema zuelzerae]MBN2811193.1 NAD(P)H-dependent oxidoreductase subunit E [Spirochaetales bacterium]MCD1654371.1 NAD(P)H-dependent oxidoreductase subunit E [Teretinema zuelzerae]HPO02437.1 NAD(P)H-dependent oxidoreductase subunit E [Treponemataceae bacterium]
MSEKIKVVICSGTACFVMGASEILLLEESLPEDLKDKVEIEGATCLGLCKDSKNGKAPFVTINGEVMTEATLPGVLQKIQEFADA